MILWILTFLNVFFIAFLLWLENREQIEQWRNERWRQKCNRRKIII